MSDNAKNPSHYQWHDLEYIYHKRLQLLEDYISEYHKDQNEVNKLNCIIAYYVAREYKGLLRQSEYNEVLENFGRVLEKDGVL